MESFLYYCKGNIVWKPETETDVCMLDRVSQKSIFVLLSKNYAQYNFQKCFLGHNFFTFNNKIA